VPLKVVIVGGDAAGMSAASKLKRELPDADVIVFERGEHISYSACGMPYWISGHIESKRKLIVLTPEVARRRRNIDVRILHEVMKLDLESKVVSGRHLPTGQTFEQPFDKLVIATGATAIYPAIPGMDLPNVFALRSLSDGERIYNYMATQTPKRGVIIGGGYIGVEMAEALHERGLELQMVELQQHIMPQLDPDMLPPLYAAFAERDIPIYTETELVSVKASTDGLYLSLHGKLSELSTDMLVIAVGVRPNTSLAQAAGIEIGPSGAIAVDPFMRTSHPDVYAAGDCVQHQHLILDQPAWIPLATSANKGGRIAGENIAGAKVAFPGILGTAVVKIFDLTVSTTGLNEHEARLSGLFGTEGEYVGCATIENPDKAGYWPSAETLQVKLVFDKRGGRVLGGQLVGKAGVNKRIDIIATAITARMTLEDIALLDLSYAPPYSPTYDPIQICANVAQKDVQVQG
jgi:NADPH-dependent 2,4-dienoyl-CoA reductase/sulfur reductase-like enzyme